MQKISSKQYNLVFSIMKGIAIIAVVWGHCTCFPFVEEFVNQWHLAVFFFVSGYFFKGFPYGSTLWDLLCVIRRKFMHLLLPFFISCTIFLLLHNVFYELHIYSSALSLTDTFNGLIDIWIRLTTSEQLTGAMYLLYFQKCFIFLVLNLSKIICGWHILICIF